MAENHKNFLKFPSDFLGFFPPKYVGPTNTRGHTEISAFPQNWNKQRGPDFIPQQVHHSPLQYPPRACVPPPPQPYISPSPSRSGQSRRSGPRRNRRRRPTTPRQIRRQSYMNARAATQIWQRNYLWDKTAYEIPCPPDVFPPGDARDPKEFVIVKAFDHVIVVPLDARDKHRAWRRFLPIGRVKLSWDRFMKLEPARLTPNVGPY